MGGLQAVLIMHKTNNAHFLGFFPVFETFIQEYFSLLFPALSLPSVSQ